MVRRRLRHGQSSLTASTGRRLRSSNRLRLGDLTRIMGNLANRNSNELYETSCYTEQESWHPMRFMPSPVSRRPRPTQYNKRCPDRGASGQMALALPAVRRRPVLCSKTVIDPPRRSWRHTDPRRVRLSARVPPAPSVIRPCRRPEHLDGSACRKSMSGSYVGFKYQASFLGRPAVNLDRRLVPQAGYGSPTLQAS